MQLHNFPFHRSENQEVAICYFRTGYTPDAFKTKEVF